MTRPWLALWLAACGSTLPVEEADADGDGYPASEDCNDIDPTVHPTAADVPYDGVDSNCLGDDDFDVDYDGFPVDVDCDDRDPTVHPGADERCDGEDQDCDGVPDNDVLDGVPVYPDADGDGFGALGAEQQMGCAAIAGWSEVATDCDDTQPEQFPGNPEVCDRLDNDCDGAVDDEVFDYTSWPDLDEDGFGDEDAAPVQTCFEVPPAHVENALDCADDRPTVYFGAPDVLCDLQDNDCDPLTSEAGAVTVDGVPATDLADAVADAPVGATIALCEGTYGGNLSITRGLHLVGSGSALTVLDGLAAGAVLAVDTTGPVTLSGLTLTNGVGRDDGSGLHEGGGLWVAADGDVEATDLQVVFNRAGQGAGVRLGDHARFSLIGGSLSDNTGDPLLTGGFPYGGGLHAGSDVALTLTDVAIERNTADGCAGMDLTAGGTTLVAGGTSAVRDNDASSFGGGGICAGADATISGLEVASNTSVISGGGIYATAPLTLTDVRLEGNDAWVGGGLFLEASDAGPSRFTGCVIIDNAAGYTGGGVNAEASLILEDSEVSNNFQSFYSRSGGGVELSGTSTLTSVNTLWVANLTDDVGMGDGGFTAGALEDFECAADTGVCE